MAKKQARIRQEPSPETKDTEMAEAKPFKDFWETDKGYRALERNPDFDIPCGRHQKEDGQWVAYDRGNRAWRPVSNDNKWAGGPKQVTPTGKIPSIPDIIGSYVKLRDHSPDRGLEFMIAELNFNYNNMNSLRVQLSKVNSKIEKAVCKANNIAYDTANREDVHLAMKKAGVRNLTGLHIQWGLQGGNKEDTTDYDAVYKKALELLTV